MPVYDFSSGLGLLNQGIDALGKGIKDAADWRQGQRLADLALGQAEGVVAAPSPPSLTIDGLGGAPPAYNASGKTPSFAGQPVQAASLLKGFEGYRDTPYWDVNAYRVGYGSDTITDPNTGEVRPVRQNDRIDRAFADADLSRRIPEFQKVAQGQAPGFGNLPSHVQAALTSVAYNYGSLPKSVVAAVNTGDVNQIASAVEALPANPDRRRKEAAVIRGGAADAPTEGAQNAQGFIIPQGKADQPGVVRIPDADKVILRELIANPSTRAQGIALLQQYRKGGSVKTVDLGGSIGVMDQQGNILRQIPKTAGPSGAEYGLQPVYGTDAQGNPVIMQLGKGGAAVQTALPEGVKLSKEPIKVDAGTHFVLIDPISRQNVGTIPKDLAGAEAQKVQGKAQGEAAVNLPNVTAKADLMLKTIEDIEKDSSLSWGTGKTSWTTSLPGTGMYDFGRKVAQLQGQSFLQAFESLKGGGQITEVEGAKAENAIARLSLSQTEEGFRTALKDLKDVISAGVNRAKQKAGPGGQDPVRVATPDDARKLPSGTPILLPDGTVGRVP